MHLVKDINQKTRSIIHINPTRRVDPYQLRNGENQNNSPTSPKTQRLNALSYLHRIQELHSSDLDQNEIKKGKVSNFTPRNHLCGSKPKPWTWKSEGLTIKHLIIKDNTPKCRFGPIRLDGHVKFPYLRLSMTRRSSKAQNRLNKRLNGCMKLINP